MKRVFVSILLLAALTALAIPAAAQSGVRVPPGNDNFNSALAFHPYADLVVTDVQDATTEGTEPEHTCAAGGATGYSVWFYTLLAPGAVTIDTTGSEYVDGLTASSNTVVSLYRQIDSSGDIDADLQSLACNDGAGAGVITNAAIPILGSYYIQVSAANGVSAADPSEVHLKVSYTPSEPLANDEPDGAKNLKLPNLLGINGLFNATTSPNEPLDSLVPAPGPLTNTVWYKFTFDSSRVLALQNAGVNLVSSATLWFSLFIKTGDVYSAVSGIEQYENGILAILSAGTYYLRVGVLYVPSGGGSIAETVIAPLYLMPPNYQFQTDAGAATSEGWTIKNVSGGDGVGCFAPSDCYFRFVSSGADEATKLQANLNLSSVKIKSGDAVLVLTSPTFTGDPNLSLSLKLTDAAGGKQKYSSSIDSAASVPGLIELAPANFKPVKSKLIVKNKDADTGHEVYLDSMIAVVYRTGAGRSSTDMLSKLPLFGSIPSAWQTETSSPKSVLPVPPAP